MNPTDKLKQLMAKLSELPMSDDKLDIAINFCSGGDFPTAQAVSERIIADIQSASSPTAFLLDSCNIDLENEDVGSIVGFDASGGPVYDKYSIVPENGSVDDLEVPPSQEVINGLTVIYPPFSSLNSSGQFIMKCLSKWWLKGAFDLVEQGYGLKFDENASTTTMPVKIGDDAASGGAITMAYVSTYASMSTGITQSIECTINTNPLAYGDMDLTDPNGRANSAAGSRMFLDRVLCHELVHAVMSVNIPGFIWLPNWFNEGTAELIAGADDTRKDELLETASSASVFIAGLDNNNPDTLKWYTTGYIWLRWFIKHTSRKGIDVSIGVLLPDIEVFEYKVSDNIAFEYGRANNYRFDLISDELVNFYVKDHVGLNKWDLCTSPDYLNSLYGSTIRIPFDDAVDRLDVNYLHIKKKDYLSVYPLILYTDVFMSDDGCVPNLFSFGRAIPSVSSAVYQVTHDSDIHRILLSLYDSSYMYNVSPVSPSTFFDSLPNGSYILLLGDFGISDLLQYIYGSSTDEALDDFIASANGYIYDFRTFNLNNTLSITQDAYINGINDSSEDYLISKLNNSSVVYKDYRQQILDKYPNVSDFISDCVVDIQNTACKLNISVPTSRRYFFSSKFASFIFDDCIGIEECISNLNIVGIGGLSGLYMCTMNYMHKVYPNLSSARDLVYPFLNDVPFSYTMDLDYAWFRIVPDVSFSEYGYGSGYDYYASIVEHISTYVNNSDSGKYFILHGIEILSVYDYSLAYAFDIILQIRDYLMNNYGVILVYEFTPTIVFSSILYDFSRQLRELLIANDINIIQDLYDTLVIDDGTFIDYWSQAGHPNSYYTFDAYDFVYYLTERTGVTWYTTPTLNGVSNAFFRYPTTHEILSEWVVDSVNVAYTKSPCYYASFTQLSFANRVDELRYANAGRQALGDVRADILDVNLHTVYDPFSFSYYQGGGTCKEVYDFYIDPITDKSMLGLINYYAGSNSPSVKGNYSFPVYGSGCPWIVYPDSNNTNYDCIYFYFTRDNYSGTITYQLTSNRYPSLKPIFQTIVFGSPDTDNYTSKYSLYVGGGVNYVTHTQYSYSYTPPGIGAKPVSVTVEGNAYDIDLTSFKTSNISPIYPVAVSDSVVTNFAYRGSDGEWKYLAVFDGDMSNDSIMYAHKLADTYYWGVIFPYVGSDLDYSYMYDVGNDIINIYKPVRILNPYRNLKEEYGFGAISLPNLFATCSDNRFGFRKVMSREYESKSIFDIDYMSSIADGDIINIVGNYSAYGGDVSFTNIGNSSIVLTDPYDEFDIIDVVFTDDSGANKYVATWHKNSLVNAIENSRDIDFDLTRGVVHNLSWNINISECTKKILWGLNQNCGIIDIIGYKRKVYRYLVIPNGAVNKEFCMENSVGDMDVYSLNNVLCIYLGEG